MPAKINEIRDPVHDFIIYNELEKTLINSSPLQRLKFIKQLAFTFEVYPGATHSRFEHSLGTMELASQAFDIIVRKGDARLMGEMGWSQDDVHRYRQVLRLGALLHDVGHSPFSHAPETLMPDRFSGHEDFTDLLIRSDHLRPVIEAAKPFNIEVEEVVAVALGPKKRPQEDASLQLLGELVAGELGVDRIDYLVRDALHTGAAAGRFDYQRLLNTFIVIKHPATGSPVLAIEAGGRHAAEGLLLARYFMFLQVYFHKVRRIYDRHLVDFLALFLGKFPSDIEQYLALTDDTVNAAIDRATHEGGELQALALRLRGRNHFRLAYELPAETPSKDPELFEKLTTHIEGKFPGQVRADESSKETYTLEEGDLYIVQNGNTTDILAASELIRSLRPLWLGRIYASADLRKDVGLECLSFVEGKGATA